MTSPSNSKSHSIKNWHESFSLLDDDGGVDEEELDDDDDDHASRRNNNRSFVDFLFEAGNGNNNNNNSDHVRAIGNASTGSGIHHGSRRRLVDDPEDNDERAPFRPVADHWVSPASLSDSFIQRAYPQTSMLSNVPVVQRPPAAAASLHASVPNLARSNSNRSAHNNNSSGSLGRSNSSRTNPSGTTNTTSKVQIKSGKRYRPPRHKSARTNVASYHDSLPSPPAFHSLNASQPIMGVAAEASKRRDRAAPTLPVRAPAPVTPAAATTTTATTNSSPPPSVFNGSMNGSLNLSQVFDPELQRLDNTMTASMVNRLAPKNKPASSPPPVTTATATTTATTGKRPSTAQSLAALKAAVPKVATGVAALRVTSEAIADAETAVRKRDSHASTLATPAASKVQQGSQRSGQSQRDVFQTSAANLNASQTVASKEKKSSTNASDGNDKNSTTTAATTGLSETVHTRGHDDNDLEENKDETHSQMSDSFHDEGPDKPDKAEETEAQVRKSLLYGILTALGVMAIVMLFKRCIQCCQKQDDVQGAAGDVAGDAATGGANANQTGAASGGAYPPTGGGGSGGNAPPPLEQATVQQMAVAASQNAAASSAQGAATLASASGQAAAASSGSVMTMGIVAGVLGAGAVGTGVAMAVTRSGNGGVAAMPWKCNATVEPVLHTGHIVLYMEGVQDSTWVTDATRRLQLEQSFSDVFNKVSGGCQGTYQRILQSATVDVNDWEQTDKYFRTHWAASVWCNGECPELEPLFYIPADEFDTQAASLYGGKATSLEQATPDDVAVTTTRSSTPLSIDKDSLTRRLQLQQDANNTGAWFLLSFASNLTQALTNVVHSDNATNQAPVVVFDGFTLSPIDGELVERIGSPESGSPFSDVNVTQDIYDLTGFGSSQRPHHDDAIPVCPITPTQTTETGRVSMMIENLDCQALMEGDALSNLENLFRSVFNRVGHGCEGSFHRVMQDAILVDCVPTVVTDSVRGKVTYADTNWTSEVLCDGCRDPEPLFLLSYEQFLRRKLQDAVFLKQFVANMTSEMNSLLGDGADSIEAFYAATISTVDPKIVIESFGHKISGGIPAEHDFKWVNPKAPNENSAFGNIFRQTNSSNAQNSTPCATTNGESFTYSKGRVKLMIENVPSDLLDFSDSNNIDAMEAAFKDAYNTASGMCEGDFQRIVHNATLLTWDFDERGDGVPFVETQWVVDVSCNGCNPEEPLFLPPSSRDTLTNTRRLQMDLSSLMGKFANQFTSDFDAAVEELILAEDPEAEVSSRMSVFYVESLSSDGTKSMGTTGYHPQFYLNTGESVARPQRPQAGSSSASESQATADLNSTELMDACLKDLVIVDTNYNNILEMQEYVKFIHRYAQQIYPDIDIQLLQRELPLFKSLPANLQDHFNTFASGGTIPIYGDKKQAGVRIEQEQFLQNFCNGTASLIWIDGMGTDPPAAANVTAEPTQSPTTSMAPSVSPTANEVGGGAVVSLPVSNLTLPPTPVPTVATAPPTILVTEATNASSNTTAPPSLGASTVPATTVNVTAPPSNLTTLEPSSLAPTVVVTNVTLNSTAIPVSLGFPPSLTNSTSAPTAAPTIVTPAPTAAPTVSTPVPTPAPTTMAPTALNVHAMVYKIKFYINYEGFVDREPTPEEYEGLRTSLESYFFGLIGRHYENSTDYVLTGHNLTLVAKDYIPNPTEDRYTHCLYFISDFTFAGASPEAKEVFQVFDDMSLQELTEGAIWVAEPQDGLFYATSGILWTTDVDYGQGVKNETNARLL